jgi:hypothetical protein
MFRGDGQKSFLAMQDYQGERGDAALSLDVIYHLVEDDVFQRYLRTVFAAGRKLVVIYASNTDVQESPQPPHVRHREFTRWVAANQPQWRLIRQVDNRIPYDPRRGTGSQANFYIYSRT